MEAHGVLGYLTENALYSPNIDNLRSNCCGHFRFGSNLPLKFGKNLKRSKNEWDSNPQSHDY